MVGRLGYILFLFFSIIEFSVAQSSYSIFDANGSKGIVDNAGKEIIPPEYEDIGWSNGNQSFNGEVIGYKKDGKWGLLSRENLAITAPIYHQIEFQETQIVASKKGEFSSKEFYGIINKKGKIVIPFTYAGLKILGNAIVAQKHNYNQRQFGLIGFDNTIRLPFVYSNIYPISANLLVIEKGSLSISIADMNGKQVVSYPIDSVSYADKNHFYTWENGKTGLVDTKGASLLEPIYKEIRTSSNAAEALTFNTWLFFKEEGTILSEMQYDNIIEVGVDLYITKTNEQYRIVDMLESKQSDAFESIDKVEKGFFIVGNNGLKGLASKDEIIVPIRYDTLHYNNGFIYASNIHQTASWSIFDTLGIEKSKHVYQAIKEGTENRFQVLRNNKWGFIDRTGNEIIHCVFDSVSTFENGKSKVVFHGEEGIISLSGEWLIYPVNKELSIINDTLYLEKSGYQSKLKSFEGELVYFTENELQVLPNYLIETVDSATKWRISFQGTIFDRDSKNEPEPILFQDSLFIISKGNVKGIVTSSGEEIIPFVNEDIIPGPDKFLAIKRDGFYGFVDMDNKLRISNRYEDVKPFYNELAAIQIRGKWGFINKKEIIVTQPIYQEVGSFSHGICPILLRDKWGLIDLKGNVVVEPELDELYQTENGNWISKQGSSYGLIDQSGMTILLTKYQSVIPVDEHRTIVKRKGKYGVADQNGVMQVGFNYDHLEYHAQKGLFVAMQKGEWTTIALFPK